MWKTGELVWANFKHQDLWIPGRVQDPSGSYGVLVSFFGLKEPRFFPAPLLRPFEHDFRTRIMDSWELHRGIVNGALRAYFWSVSYGLWCPCQPPITSPYLDREISVLWPSLCSDLALGFVREIAISHSVPLEGVADANLSTALIRSFRRYTVDFEQSEALYEEVRLNEDLVEDGAQIHPSKSGEHDHDVVEHSSHLDEAATTRETQTRNHDNANLVKTKREASLNAASADSFKKQKTATQQSASFDKPWNPHAKKASRIADPRCLQMKFLGSHDDLPSEASLVKRFSVFGRIDASKTYVDKHKRSAKVTFLRSIDAVMAYKYARSKKISFGQSKVVYTFDLFEQSSERNTDNVAQEAPEHVPKLKPCLKKPGSAGEARRYLKVKLQMEDNG